MKKIIKNEEIDFIELLIHVWKNKIKIIIITLIFIALSSGIYFLFKPNFLTTTKIIPISKFKDNEYYYALLPIKKIIEDEIEVFNLSSLSNSNAFSNLNLNNTEFYNKEFETDKFNLLKKINKKSLFDMFIYELKNKEIYEQAFKKFEYIDQSKFKNEELYLLEIQKIISNIKINPTEENKKNKDDIYYSWQIDFEINNKEKWKKILNYINNEINEKIRKEILYDFELYSNTVKNLNLLILKDLEYQIERVKQNYKLETSKKLIFLKEQAEIAKKINLKSNEKLISQIIEVNNNTRLQKDETLDNFYYLKGYEVSEKEIELIKKRSRDDEHLINVELNKYILKKELIKKQDTSTNIISNLTKAKIFSRNNFVASTILYNQIDFKEKNNFSKYLALSTFFSFLFAIIFVFISNSIQQRQ